MRRGLGLLVLVAAFATVLVAQHPDRAQATATQAPTLVMTGVLRCASGKFSALNDAGHQSFGIASVQTLSDRVRVTYTTPITAYGTAFADPDETYTIHDIDTGASGALDHMDIFIAKGGVKISPTAACISGSNIWVEAKGYLD